MDHSKGAALNHQPPQIIHSREVLVTFDGTKVTEGFGRQARDDVLNDEYRTWKVVKKLLN